MIMSGGCEHPGMTMVEIRMDGWEVWKCTNAECGATTIKPPGREMTEWWGGVIK